MSINRVELPGIFFDNVVEDAVVSSTDSTPILINQDPEPNETFIPGDTNIQLDIATLDASSTVDLSSVSIYVNNVLAFQAGTFETGFNGPASAYSNPHSDVLRVILDPTNNFASEEVVFVRVVAQASSGGRQLDTTYEFTIADTTPPSIIAADAIDLTHVRVTFSESVMQDAPANTDSALDPANWTLDRLGDYLHPLVSAKVVEVLMTGELDTVEVVTDIPLTPGGNYRLTAINLEDQNGNAIEGPDNVIDFLGWQPPVPTGRVFDLYKKLPLLNQSEDTTLDLFRFIACLQEVANLLLYDIDRWVDQLDPDTADEDVIDVMLADLGNPFAFDLSLTDKRRLIQVLVAMYGLKGTGEGIISVVRFFLALEVTIDAFNLTDCWLLGESELGVDTVLMTTNSASLYSFTVTVDSVLTDAQRAQIRSIVTYMKPAHTHFIQLIEPPPPPPAIDHMELGLSELGDNWLLH